MAKTSAPTATSGLAEHARYRKALERSPARPAEDLWQHLSPERLKAPDEAVLLRPYDGEQKTEAFWRGRLRARLGPQDAAAVDGMSLSWVLFYNCELDELEEGTRRAGRRADQLKTRIKRGEMSEEEVKKILDGDLAAIPQDLYCPERFLAFLDSQLTDEPRTSPPRPSKKKPDVEAEVARTIRWEIAAAIVLVLIVVGVPVGWLVTGGFTPSVRSQYIESEKDVAHIRLYNTSFTDADGEVTLQLVDAQGRLERGTWSATYHLAPWEEGRIEMPLDGLEKRGPIVFYKVNVTRK